MAGGTWKIIVEEGAAKTPTQSSAARTPEQKAKAKAERLAQKAMNDRNRAVKRTLEVGAVGAGIAVAGVNQYFSITGQTAKKNRFNATAVYAAAGTRFITQLASGNFVGAAVTGLVTGAALGTQYFNFQKDIAEQNANAEYLRQRSNTSVTNGKDIYRFSL